MRGIFFRFAVAGKADGVSALSVGVAAVRPLRPRGYTAACSLNAGHYSIFPADCQVIFRRRGVPPVAPDPPALAVPGGGLPALSPARPTFSFVPAPIPQPPSRREGGDLLVFLCKGLRPLHPPEPNPSGMGTEQRILRRASACSRRHRLTRHRRQPNVACSCLVGSFRPRCPRRSRGQSTKMPPSSHCFSTISVPLPLLRIQRGGTVPRTEDSG